MRYNAISETLKWNLISLLNDVRKGGFSSIFRCPLFYEKYSNAILSYSDHLLLHNNHLQLSGKTKTNLLHPWFSGSGVGKGTAEFSYLCSAVSGTLAGKSQILMYLKVGVAAHLDSQLQLLTTIPTHSLSIWFLHFFTAWWLRSKSKYPKIHLPVMAEWDQEGNLQVIEWYTGQRDDSPPEQNGAGWRETSSHYRMMCVNSV